MHAYAIIAVSGIISAVAAVPMAQQHHHHHRRDYVWETVTQEVVQTIPVTKTIWLEPGESVPTDNSHAVAPAAWDPPAASSPAPYKWTSSSYVPPVPSTSAEPVPSSTASSSSYVAPTSSATPVPPPPPPTSSYVPPPPPPPPTSTYTPPPPPVSTYTPPPPPVSTYTPPPPPVSTYTPPPPPPTTSSSVYTPPVVPSSSAAPAPAPTSPSSGDSNGISSGPAVGGTYYTGDLTYFTPGVGACGIPNTEADHIVAIPESIFDVYTPAGGNPNLNPLCGTSVTITGADGSPYQATITDRCTGCTVDDLDLTPALFKLVVPNGNGRVHGMKWCFS